MGSARRERRHGDLLDVAVEQPFQLAVGIGLVQSFDIAVDVDIEFAVCVGVDFALGFCVHVTFNQSVCDVMSDLTVIYLTCNKMPSRWVEFHRGHLLQAVDDRPLITISAKPVDLPGMHLEQTGPFSDWNVYVQLLRGAKLAETKYVAVAEDDTLYPARHFNDFRPPDDAVAYDMSRWSVFSWVEKPFFSAIRRHGNFTMIGPRQLVIEALEEREKKYPNGSRFGGEIGRDTVERNLRVTPRKRVEWYCIEPMVNLAHPQGLSKTYIDTPGLERKTGELKAWDIPIWGKASDITAIYNQGVEEDARLAESA